MESIAHFLANPIISLIGYVLSIISALIAVKQAMGKSNAVKRVSELTVQINSIREENRILKLEIDKTTVSQGDKSQYFKDNSGNVNIDNRS